jgi:hypothetical protein
MLISCHSVITLNLNCYAVLRGTRLFITYYLPFTEVFTPHAVGNHRSEKFPFPPDFIALPLSVKPHTFRLFLLDTASIHNPVLTELRRRMQMQLC